VRYAAALPSAALLSGAAYGLAVDNLTFARLTSVALAGAAAIFVTAVAILRNRRPPIFQPTVAAVFFVGGVFLSSDAWQRAWHAPLRGRFEELARKERAEAEAIGQRRPLDDEASATLEGLLRGDAAASEAGVSLSVAVDSIRSAGSEREGFSRASGGVLLTVTGELARFHIGEWRSGRRVRLPARLHRPQRYLDPGVPDAERSLARRGTSLVGTVKSGALVDVLAGASRWDESISAVRAFARTALAASVDRYSPQSGGIVAAIVIGDRSRLDADLQRRLQEAGTYHVVAISGGNIAILAGVLLWTFRAAGWFGRSAMLASVALIIGYARFVGGGASVDRAAIMAAAYFGARVFDQRTAPLNALAVVAAILVAVDPLSIADPAFLLTFGATLAILIAAPIIEPWIRGRRSAAVARIAAASVAVEILLLPVGAFLFSRVTFAGLVLNVLAIPLMGVAQIAGMLVVPAALVSASAAAAIGWVAHLGASGLVWSASLVQFVPAATWRVATPAAATCALYYAGLVAFFVGWRVRKDTLGSREPPLRRWTRLGGCAIWLGAAAWIIWEPASILAARGDGRLHVTFIDVGQGDSIFVVFPRGSTLLVDAGGVASSSGFNVGDRVVAPVVRASEHRRIDRLALSHGDPDHIGGAMSILREFRPVEVWEGIAVPRPDALTALRTEAQSLGARWRNVYAGASTQIDDVDVVAWNPRPPEWERQRVRNDDSLVLEIRWRDVSVLLTGDIGKSPEAEVRSLMGRLPPKAIRVIKVPHHGSLTSSSQPFVEAIRPQIAVVSAGRLNHFGHPVPEVLKRYEAVGAEIFRTDRDGAVLLETDGWRVSVRSHESTK
jgi:competence protein ComEC